MNETVLLEVQFPPTVGYKSGKAYTYASSLPRAREATHAIVVDPQNQPQLVKVVNVQPYATMPFRVKQVLSIITAEDMKNYQELPLL